MSDVIHREDAIKAVWKPVVKPDAEIFTALKKAIQSEIEALPPANLERKHGEWIIRGKNGHECSDMFECSICNKWVTRSDYIEDNDDYMFCPYCGSSMEGGITCNAED